jgi:serine/threonine protein kinase
MIASNTILQNRYRIIRQLAEGGMGTVYEAADERLDTTVALKECHFTDERLKKQFEREARLLARLRHPAITRVIDHFTDGAGQFLVMDFVAGEDLWEMLQSDGAFQVDRVLEWADQLLDALDYLHKQNPPIIHRDIKPQNLKLSSTGQIILLDFGLAKGFAGQVSRVTTSGSIFGYTPNYAPLEQIQGTGTDPRSDLYSLAAALYHLITGVVPPDVLTRLTATTDGQSDPLRSARKVNPQVTHDLAGVLNKAMAIGRNQRFASAAEMRKALESAESVPKREKVILLPTVASPTAGRISQNLNSTIAAEKDPDEYDYFCMDCGGIITNEDRTCFHCGADTSEFIETEETSRKSNKIIPLIILVGFLILLIFMIVATYSKV